MQAQFNFQVNHNDDRRPWDEVAPYSLLTDRPTAVALALRLARQFCAEIRLTEGRDHKAAGGAYFARVQN